MMLIADGIKPGRGRPATPPEVKLRIYELAVRYGVSARAIATRMNLSQSHVEKVLHRMRQQLVQP